MRNNDNTDPGKNSPPVALLQAKHVTLRGLRRDDLESVRSWWDNDEATQYMETDAFPTTDAMLENFYRASTEISKAVVFVVEERSTGRAIGLSGLYEIFWPGRRAEFRILIGDPGVFDKGYGTEATLLTIDHGFLRLNMEVIHLGVNAANARAVRAYEKAGFVHEGIRRRFVYSRGHYNDAVVMSMLRDDYLAAKQM